MNKYKPEYLGKVIPVNDPAKITDFVENKYDAFTKVYEACKEQSEKITDIKPVDQNSANSLSVQIIADSNTIANIQESNKDDESLTIQDTVITAEA